jgi:DNA-directed RNA polymerase specialized sigma24 family protein
MGSGPQRQKWKLNEQAWERFLALLDPDRDRAAEKYEEIRRIVATFFRCNGLGEADDLVDETLDRAIRRSGDVEIQQPRAFVCGIARLVASERRKLRFRNVPLDGSTPIRQPDPPDPQEGLLKERRLECLERCVQSLKPDDRNLILEFHKYEKTEKIENKRNLAAVLGITVPTLRVRAHRVRQQLEACVNQGMKQWTTV